MFKIIMTIIWLCIVCAGASYMAEKVAESMDNMANVISQAHS
jgi:hypothetical protein